MKLGTQVGLGPDHIVLDGDLAPPSPQGHSPHPIFGPYMLRPSGCMDQDATGYGARRQPRRLCVRWGPRSTLPKKGDRAPSPIAGPFLLWPNGCMHQDATWYGDRLQHRGLCVRWGLTPPPPLNFRPMFCYSYCDFVRTLHNAQSLLVCPSSSFSILCILFLERKNVNRTQSVR